MTSTEDVVVVAGEPVAPVAAVPSGPLTVTVPPTAKGGDTIAVEMPNGQKMNVVVPAGLTAGRDWRCLRHRRGWKFRRSRGALREKNAALLLHLPNVLAF